MRPKRLTLSVMRNDDCDVHTIRVDCGFNSWRKFSIWRGQKVVPGSKNRELCVAPIVNSERIPHLRNCTDLRQEYATPSVLIWPRADVHVLLLAD
jgi:hypothetical protein